MTDEKLVARMLWFMSVNQSRHQPYVGELHEMMSQMFPDRPERSCYPKFGTLRGCLAGCVASGMVEMGGNPPMDWVRMLPQDPNRPAPVSAPAPTPGEAALRARSELDPNASTFDFAPPASMRMHEPNRRPWVDTTSDSTTPPLNGSVPWVDAGQVGFGSSKDMPYLPQQASASSQAGQFTAPYSGQWECHDSSQPGSHAGAEEPQPRTESRLWGVVDRAPPPGNGLYQKVAPGKMQTTTVPAMPQYGNMGQQGGGLWGLSLIHI
eukprot:TRINITY_DN3205_c0_g1_i2.p1 TRINITY_DN3205_c0_g1~~TRINITY_DN3205_c0_g1_i2.p1  ORF type:complete len:265 (-),score=44.28 TRINITY_DN3205_c0_g1_i2:170-964(-)